MITLLDYERHTTPYKSFGSIKVELLDAAYWAIGKIHRYYDSDIEDVLLVFKKEKPDLKRLVTLWAKALRESPTSSEQHHFKAHVIHFLINYGAQIWKSKTKIYEWISLFEQTTKKI